MEVKCKETEIACLQPVCREVLRHEETVESVVPDTMPDISSILCTCGTLLIRSKDLSEGCARIDANIPVKVTYQPETGEELCLLELNVPLSVATEHPEINDECLCDVRLFLVSLDTKALNPRKISVHAEACAEIVCYRRNQFLIPATLDEKAEGLFYKECEAAITTVSSLQEKTFVLTDEFRLAAGTPGVTKILCQKTLLDTEEVKSVGGRLVLKGRVKSQLLYLSQEGTPAAIEFSTGFSQIIESEHASGATQVSASVLLSGAYYDISASSDGSTIGMELHLVVQVTVYEQQNVRYLADAYSNCYAVTLGETDVPVSNFVRELLLRDILREVVETPFTPVEIVGSLAEPGSIAVNGAQLSMPVNIQIYYSCSAGQLHCIRRSFLIKFQADLAPGEQILSASASLQELYAVMGAGGLELRMPVELTALVFSEKTLRMVSAISWDEDHPQDLSKAPSLVLCTVCSEDDLWLIAKENCSSVEAIVQANSLETRSGEWKSLILIPKVLF